MARLRKFERGYNQSKLIADVLGDILKCPVQDVLKRRSGDFSQAGLSHQQRLELDADAIILKGSPDLYEKHILLVDDVMTTGSSLCCCAEVLRGCCPSNINAITICKA